MTALVDAFRRHRSALERARGAVLLVLALLTVAATTGDAAVTVTAAATIAVVALLARRASALVPGAATLRVGGRSAGHRESLDHDCPTRHPDTAGKTRSRAPGDGLPAV